MTRRGIDSYRRPCAGVAGDQLPARRGHYAVLEVGACFCCRSIGNDIFLAGRDIVGDIDHSDDKRTTLTRELPNEHTVLEIGPSDASHVGLLVAFDTDVVSEKQLVAVGFTFPDRCLVVEVDLARRNQRRGTSQIDFETQKIAFAPVRGAKTNPRCHTVCQSVESCTRGDDEVGGVRIGQIVQRMNAALAFLVGRSLAKFDVQVRIGRAIITDRSQALALCDSLPQSDSGRDTGEVKMHDENNSISRVVDLEDDVSGREAAAFITGEEHGAVAYCVHRRAAWGRQIDSVVEIPTVQVDARPVRGIHLVGRGALAQWPDV
ncbi:MAG TPA: hypothetical protein VFP91_11110 [Vicinamibacterales bacterium]|nr:hypothetical protein [Vicinamibacterales bacterium]